MRLFVERAQAAYPEFALMEDNATTVVEVCRRLDGLPLAIELAAAHARLFAPTVMLAQLVHPLKFLRGGPQDKPARHRTLWNTIDWSYRLLDETEQVLFRHLSVFANGWETAAAAAVSQVPEVEAGLEALVRKSLIRVVSTDGALGVRFQMLHTVREYAAEQLKAGGESEAARRRHAMYYLALVEEAEPHAKAGRQSAWVARIEQEHDNLRAALSWMLEQGEAELALRLVGSVWRIWQVLNILSEGRRWLEQALHLGQYVRTPDRIKALLGAGWLAICQGSDARAAFEEGLALALDLGARRFLPSLLQGIGNVTKDNNPEFARTQFQESLRIARELGDDEEVGWALDHLGRLELDCGHYAQARVFLEESLAIFRRLQHHWGVTYVLDHLGRVMLAQEQWKEAQALLEEALLGMETFGVRMHVPWTLEALARAILPQGDRQRARNLLARALRLHREAENPLGIALTLSGLAMLAIESADYERAVKLCGAASAMLNVTDPAQLSAVYSYGQWILNSVAAARPPLDEEAFIAAWRGGQAMTPEKAITLAMTTE
ncbi:MAG: tetratricopeptide repeat protein [Anaerolineae bacterium]|nr:tetratricopeptide repeat protein [Anaerolineae bacterium]